MPTNPKVTGKPNAVKGCPSILQWNANGLGNRLTHLRAELLTRPYEVVLLQEPRMDVSKITIPSYTTYCCPGREKQPWAAVLVHKDTTHCRVESTDYSTDTSEFVGIRVRKNDRIFSIFSCYIHPDAAWSGDVIQQIHAREKGVIILGGDFNSHNELWGDRKTTPRGKRLQEALEHTDLEYSGTGEPTFTRRGVEQSVLDLTFCSAQFPLTTVLEKDSWGSDHIPITSGPVPRPPNKTCKVVHWDRYRAFLRQYEAMGWPLDSQAISAALKEATTTVSIPIERPNPDFRWLQLRAKRRQAQRVALRTGRHEDTLIYRRQDALFKRHGKRLAREQWKQKCESFDGPRGATQAWRMARTLCNRPGPRDPIAGMALALNISDAEVRELLADTLLSPPPAPAARAAPPGWRDWKWHAKPQMKEGLGDFQLHELERALASLPRKKSAPGADGVTTAALRNLDKASHPALLELLNRAWRDANIPSEWRSAIVVPIPKPGKPTKDPSSFRPIALTSCMGKLLERMVKSRLEHHLESVGGYPESTCGFRRHHCTADAIADLVTTLEESKAKSWTTGVVLLDVSKAFDAVKHSAILDMLRLSGIEGRPLHYVRAYLSGREAQVRAARGLSTPRKINCGVPQGGVLSPLLFNVAMAALPQIINIGQTGVRRLQIAVYADDIALWATARGLHRGAVQKALQKGVTNIEHYLSLLGLSLSPSKSVVLCNAPHYTYRFSMKIKAGGTEIPIKKQAAYLGVQLDRKATWAPAVAEVIRKCQRHTRIIRMLAGTRRGTSQGMLLILYKGLILSRALYALPLLTITENQWELLERMQRTTLRVCLGVPRTASSRHTLNDAGVTTVRLAAAERAMRHLIRIGETRGTTGLPERILQRKRSQLAAHARELFRIAGGPGNNPTPPPPSEEPPLRVELNAGLDAPKRHMAPTTARQHAEHHIHTQFLGWARTFTDGSVNPASRTASAAAVSEDTGRAAAEKLSFHASSTTAELAALNLALSIVDIEGQPDRLVVLCDSKAALGLLTNLDRAPALARVVAQKAIELQRRGWTLAFQWVPAHCGVRGNESADRLAAAAQEDPTCPISKVPAFSDARLLVRRVVAARHPELEHGPLPPRPPRNMRRGEAAAIHRLRTGSAFTPEYRARWRPDRDRSCPRCAAAVADDAHLLLECPDFDEERSRLYHRYITLGCSTSNFENLIRPQGKAAQNALTALAGFLVATGLADQI